MVYEPCIILKPEMVQISPTARVDGFTKIEGGRGVVLGEHVHIASFSHLNVGGGKLIFEDHSGCSSHCTIATGTPDWSYLYISAADPIEHHHVKRYVTIIGAYALICAGVTIVPGVKIGEGAVVKPGSVVFSDVEAWKIVEGNPARVVGNRKVSSKELGFNGHRNRISILQR